MTAARTARALVTWAERRLAAARLAYGHGTEDARQEAVFLILHALGLEFDCPESVLDAALDDARVEAARTLVERRIATRMPAAYLTRRMWFAGLEFYVDERVLVPRSPIAELVERGFAPWIDPERVRRVLDIGTGSGCIAVAAAVALPQARVDATDLSRAALEVAAVNVARHGLAERVCLHEADLYPPLGGPWDVIVSNPPYVRTAAIEALPPEYRHEPALALAGGADGLDFVRRILAGARARLAPGGVLVVEAGGEAETLERAYPRLPFTWADLTRGGEGVFVLTREELDALV